MNKQQSNKHILYCLTEAVEAIQQARASAEDEHTRRLWTEVANHWLILADSAGAEQIDSPVHLAWSRKD